MRQLTWLHRIVSGSTDGRRGGRSFWKEWSGSCRERRSESLIEPHYPKAGNGRPPVGLGIVLRVAFLSALVQPVGSRS